MPHDWIVLHPSGSSPRALDRPSVGGGRPVPPAVIACPGSSMEVVRMDLANQPSPAAEVPIRASNAIVVISFRMMDLPSWSHLTTRAQGYPNLTFRSDVPRARAQVRAPFLQAVARRLQFSRTVGRG
jgi:hypothetical protein